MRDPIRMVRVELSVWIGRGKMKASAGIYQFNSDNSL